MTKASFKTNFKDIQKSLDTMRKDIRDNAMFTGLDKPLNESLKDLKKSIRSTTRSQTVKSIEQSKERPSIAPPRPEIQNLKSKDVIVSELAGLKIEDYNKNKDVTHYYQATNGSKLVVAQPSRGQQRAARITLRQPIFEGETVSTQLQRAKEFFSQAILAKQAPNGDLDYILNTENIDDQVKIKCSKYTGDDDFKEFGGLSPQERFDKDNSDIGYSEWTIKQDVVERMLNNGINLSRVADSIMNQDFDEARDYINARKHFLDSRNKEKMAQLEEIERKVVDFEENQNLTPDSTRLNNIYKLINTLEIKKFMKADEARYEVWANTGKEEAAFMMLLNRELSLWKSANADKWVKILTKEIVKVIRKHFEVK